MEKTLYFEGAGCSGTKRNDVENCRIRTAFHNDKGESIYLELTSCEVSKHSATSLKKYTFAGFKLFFLCLLGLAIFVSFNFLNTSGLLHRN